MLNRTRGAVYQTDYHLVFHTKYQKKVLQGKIATTTREVLAKTAKQKGCLVNEITVMPEHVHMLISIPLQVKIPEIVKNLKGVTSYYLFRKFPNLRQEFWKGHLWAPSYFVRTSGNVTIGTIKKYIKEQTKKH